MPGPLDKVKALLAALDPEDQRELRRYLNDILVTPDEAEALTVARLEARAPGGGTITYTFRQERVRCGKAGCWCGEGAGHGPYTYKYWKEDGRLRKQYLGKPGGPRPVSRPHGKGAGALGHGSTGGSSSDPTAPA